MTDQNGMRNKRLISGARVLCRCSLVLPKLDPFSALKVAREGYMVINVRGASLYMAEQFSDEHAKKVFPEASSPRIKKFVLYPPNAPAVQIGEVNVRYIRLTNGVELKGLILRFVNTTEKQLDQLNELLTLCPQVEGDEESAIPRDKYTVKR